MPTLSSALLIAANTHSYAPQLRRTRRRVPSDTPPQLLIALHPSHPLRNSRTHPHPHTPSPTPPPPPPPPPLPPKRIISDKRGKEPTAAETDAMLSLARSSLRRTTPPTEEPINPPHGLGRAKRTGQPTVNVGADKMAAFLNELKTHRLRKINNSANGSFMDLSSTTDHSFSVSHNDPRSRSLDGFAIPSLPTRIGPSTSFTLGEKRKRTDNHDGPGLRKSQLSR